VNEERTKERGKQRISLSSPSLEASPGALLGCALVPISGVFNSDQCLWEVGKKK
jgi:hypothetical protein